ncbi:MAG: hypothetical protein V3U82_07355 [Robiginitomaculum sp.]
MAIVSGASAPAHAESGEMISGQRVKLKKLIRDMDGVRADIKTTGPSAFQDQAVVDAKKNRLRQFFDALKRYPQILDESSKDADVLAARASYKALKATLGTEYRRAQEQMGGQGGGNPQVYLKAIETALFAHKMPNDFYPPYEQAKLEAWTSASNAARKAALESLPKLEKIAKTANLPANTPGTPQSGAPYDKSDISRLTRFARGQIKKSDEAYAALAKGLSDAMVGLNRDVPRYKGQYAKANFGKARAIADASLLVEKALGRDGAEAQKMLTLIDYTQNILDGSNKHALSSARLPKPKSKDRKRAKIAKEIMAIPKYEFGKHGPIVLTTDKIVSRTRSEKEWNKGKLTVWTYTWDEFMFVTPIKEDGNDKYYMWTITAKKFSSGATTTPIGRWVSGKAVKGDEILKGSF